MTARSVTGSRPTIVAEWLVPSLKVTRSEPPSAAPATTWLLVRIRPSLSMITPVPSPPPPLAEVSTMDTTLGRTAAATCSTDPSAALVSELPFDAARSESTLLEEVGRRHRRPGWLR